MIPKMLHFVVPEVLSADQHQMIAHAQSVHPEWEVKIWKDADNVQDARLAKYLCRAQSGAQRADLIRLDVIFAHGGIYLDSDFKVLKPLDAIVENYDCFVCSEDGYVLSNRAVGAQPRHPAIDSIISFLESSEPNWSLPPNETTGPVLFGTVLRWRSDVAVLPRQTFYPYLYNETAGPPHRHSYGEHLWVGWRQRQLAEGTRESHFPIIVNLKSASKQALRRALSHARSQIDRARRASRPQNVLATHPIGCYPCTSELIVRTVHGHKLVIDGHDLSISPDLALTGYHEWQEEAFVRRVVRGGDWFVDVGANVGVFSILAAGLCGPFGRVLAFEPNDRLGQLLKKSATTNWYHDRIKLFTGAVGDTVGVETLTYYPDRLGDGQVRASEKGGEPFKMTGEFLTDRHEIEVNICRLDDVIPVDLPIKMLKIDTEGHEIPVLRGAERLLSNRAFDYVMLEAQAELSVRRWHQTLSGLKMLVDYGYLPGSIDQDGVLAKWSSIDEAISRRNGKTLVFYARDQ